MIGFRSPPEFTATIDAWAARQEDKPPRSEAIRRLVEYALSAPAASRLTRHSPKAEAKASDMAGQQIDKLGDASATVEERQSRKRRLLKGPKEFRDIRALAEQPKRKR